MRDPDLSGPFGKAWNLKRQEGSHEAGLTSWLVNRPGAHPFWQWWLVGIAHLRDVPGERPAYKAYPEAEHEFMIFSIDPERCPNPQPDDPEGYPALSPLDVVEQFHGISDRDAVRMCEAAAKAIVESGISPDQDYRPLWKELIAQTVAHFVEGKHPLH